MLAVVRAEPEDFVLAVVRKELEDFVLAVIRKESRDFRAMLHSLDKLAGCSRPTRGRFASRHYDTLLNTSLPFREF